MTFKTPIKLDLYLRTFVKLGKQKVEKVSRKLTTVNWVYVIILAIRHLCSPWPSVTQSMLHGNQWNTTVLCACHGCTHAAHPRPCGRLTTIRSLILRAQFILWQVHMYQNTAISPINKVLASPIQKFMMSQQLERWLGLLRIQRSDQSVQLCLQLVYLLYNNGFSWLKNDNYIRVENWMQIFRLTSCVFGNTFTSSENGNLLMTRPLLASSPSTSGSRAAGLSSSSNAVPLMKSSNQLLFDGVDS